MARFEIHATLFAELLVEAEDESAANLIAKNRLREAFKSAQIKLEIVDQEVEIELDEDSAVDWEEREIIDSIVRGDNK